MQVPKLVPQDSSSLHALMHRKVKLGVIHPVHTPVIKEEVQDDFSDLQIIAKHLNISSKTISKKQIPDHLIHPDSTPLPTKVSSNRNTKPSDTSSYHNTHPILKTTQIQFERPKTGRSDIDKTPKKEEKKANPKGKSLGGQFRYNRGRNSTTRRTENDSKKGNISKSPGKSDNSKEEENSISEVFKGYYEKAKGLFNKLTLSPARKNSNALPPKKLPKAAERYKKSSSSMSNKIDSIIKEESGSISINMIPDKFKTPHRDNFQEVSGLDPELDDFIYSMNAKDIRNQAEFSTPEPSSTHQALRDSRTQIMKTQNVAFHPFMDPDGSVFNPHERFGQSTISPLPKEDEKEAHFVKEMMKRKPDETNPWYIRAHHLKSVTQHPLSVPDDPDYYIPTVKLPTRPEEQPPIDNREDALNYLEQALSDLKCELSERKKSAVYESISAMPENKYNGWVAKVAEIYTYDNKQPEKDELIHSTYEGILNELRRRERMILNQRRDQLYESLRPPKDRWYELKSHEFSDEMHKHRMVIQPNDAHRKMLNSLSIKDIY